MFVSDTWTSHIRKSRVSVLNMCAIGMLFESPRISSVRLGRRSIKRLDSNGNDGASSRVSFVSGRQISQLVSVSGEIL